MSEIKIELNSSGIQELLKSAEMQAEVTQLAEQVQASAGEGYSVKTTVGQKRCNAKVYPDGVHAYNSNLKHNTLLKALGSVKG